MLHKAGNLRGLHIEARDGDIGYIDDLLFHDARWNVRYVVADTSRWLPGRKVLLIPEVFQSVSVDEQMVSTDLTKSQVKGSPDIKTDRPVSRQKEVDLFEHYGWSPYWGGGHGGFTQPVMPGVSADEQELSGAEPPGDPHLRSMRAVERYSIHTSDRSLGHVEDFIIDDAAWMVRYLLIDTHKWLPGRKVLVPPTEVVRIDWQARSVTVGLSAEQIKNSPEYEGGDPIDRDYEVRLHHHFGWPGYWE